MNQSIDLSNLASPSHQPRYMKELIHHTPHAKSVTGLASEALLYGIQSCCEIRSQPVNNMHAMQHNQETESNIELT